MHVSIVSDEDTKFTVTSYPFMKYNQSRSTSIINQDQHNNYKVAHPLLYIRQELNDYPICLSKNGPLGLNICG